MDNDVGFFLEKKYQTIVHKEVKFFMKKKISAPKKLGIYAVDVDFLKYPYLFTKVLLLFKLAVFDLMVAIKVKCDFRQSLNPIHLRERGKKW